MNLDDMRRHIEGELASVNHEVVALKKEPRAEELEGFGDNTPISEEMDAMAVGESEELWADRLGHLLDRTAALEEALHRLDEGTYGICLSCGGRIGSERLRALPEAAYCLRCKQEQEAKPLPEEIHGNEWRLTEDVEQARKEFEEGGVAGPNEKLAAAARRYVAE